MARAKVTHPFTGVKRLRTEIRDKITVFYAAREAKYKNGTSYWHEDTFAFVRRGCDGNGVMTDNTGFVVTRDSFEELRHFSTYEEAMAYVEALFALEN
jgi:hypothetical protein